MKELKTDYYFKDMKACPCPEAFKGIEFVWEALDKKQKLFHDDKVVIGKNTSVHETAVIEGPVIIGDNCKIKKGVYVRPYTIIGNSCTLGANSIVKASIIFDNVVIAKKTYVGDSILGKNVWIGTGVTFSNYKISKRDIRVEVLDKVFDTKMRKLGGIIGDGSIIGSDISFNPGTLVGPSTNLYVETQRFFPANKNFKVKQTFEEA